MGLSFGYDRRIGNLVVGTSEVPLHNNVVLSPIRVRMRCIANRTAGTLSQLSEGAAPRPTSLFSHVDY